MNDVLQGSFRLVCSPTFPLRLTILLVFCQADVPAPGAYEALAAFKANRDRCDFLSRRLAPPFGSGGNRFPKAPEGFDAHIPGAGKYDIRRDIAKGIKGGTISYLRKIKKTTATPSAADYCIHPYISSSVLKQSFNTILGKPKIIEELLKKPYQRARCCQCVQKKLNWFAKPIKNYRHCIKTWTFI